MTEWSDRLIQRIRSFSRRERLWQPGDRLLLAVSGGADSIALLDIVHSVFMQEDQLHISILHVHHGLRAEADDDAAFVQTQAERYGVPCVEQRVDVPALLAETGGSVEEVARELRYGILDKYARQIGADRIVTGHTADDQAETVLMHILRGAGLPGLAGIPACRGKVIRPLLTTWRNEIEQYLGERGISFRLDGSNLTRQFQRNRIRLDLLPTLECDYAPRLRARLCQLAELAREENYALETWTDALFADLIEAIPGGLAVQSGDGVPVALRRRLWRKVIYSICGHLENVSYQHILAIEHLAEGEKVYLPGVCVARKAGRLVFLTHESEKYARFIMETLLPISGEIHIASAGCRVHTSSGGAEIAIEAGNTAVLDADALDGPLVVRSWTAGDRFRPYGTGGTRKLQDIFVDMGIPRHLRGRIPVVADARGIVWLAGYRIADRVKVLPTTQHRLRLHIEWELNPWTLKALHLAP